MKKLLFILILGFTTLTTARAQNTDTPCGKVFHVVEQMPQFPGGPAAMMKFIADSLRYPSVACENRIEGRVVVQFVVDCEGNIVNPLVVRSVDPLLDREAIRLVKLMPKWIPGKQNGKPVSLIYCVPVIFKLHAEKP
ncbi:MAG: energy transducer TonB [Prevotella sp.]|nr:energy transducer TonB [Prevotella sp.]